MNGSRPVTLITGANRGIGLAVAEDLAGQGHHVIGLARTKPESFVGTFVTVDLADAEATTAALSDIVAEHQPLRLVNNAGTVVAAPIEEIALEDYETMMAINARAALQAMQAVIVPMRAKGFGRIVNIGSRAALGKDTRIAYSASKGALLSMTRSLALETVSDGITVNLVAPGPIETDMIRQNYPEGSAPREKMTNSVPMKRFGQPEEIAHAVSYFLSDAAGFTTGQTLNVCGGLSVGIAQV